MMAATGKALPSLADFGKFSGIPAIGVAGVLPIIFVGALGEETGWRATPCRSCSAGSPHWPVR
jgi:hypothetical protein